jgi:cell filamentation protein
LSADYFADDDPYQAEGHAVLRNRPGLTDQRALDAFEALSVTQRSEEPFPQGGFDAAHFRAVHRHLFQDVYDWAGEPRTIRIFKDGSPFCYPESFDAELDRLFAWLAARDHLADRTAETFAVEAAYFLSELNAIHLFREGNGRAQTAFLAMLAAEAVHPLDFSVLEPEAWMAAMIVSFYNGTERLAAEILRLVI